MSDRALDVRTSLGIVRRHWITLAVAIVLGLLVGGGYGALRPHLQTSRAVIVLPSAVRDVATQVLIADSDPVLDKAKQSIRPAMSLQTLGNRVSAQSLTANVISISAKGSTPAQAEDIGNAVARSYVAYFNSTDRPTIGRAQVFEPATMSTGPSLRAHVALGGALGALAGTLIGVIIALAVSRADRRLLERDDIADAIGVPVVASVAVRHPSGPGGWARLLEEHQPGAVESWRLHSALDRLGLSNIRDGLKASVAVLSLPSDRGAIALGPQLAVWAATQGIQTALVLGPHQDTDAAAALHVACAGMANKPQRDGHLSVTVNDRDSTHIQRGSDLTVVVATLDGRSPQPALPKRTTETVIAVSSGAATAEQLARVAASLSAARRRVSGILVADPDPGDRTTGRLPQLTRPALKRMPTRMTGTRVETRQ